MLINLWLSRIKLWLLEEILVRVVSKLLYVSLRTISRKKPYFRNSSTFPSFPPQPEKKIQIQENDFRRSCQKCFLRVQKNAFSKTYFVSRKLYFFINFGIWNKSNSNNFQKIPKFSLHRNIFVEWNVISQVFLSERKNFSIISFRILTDEISKRKIKYSTGFPKLYSTCPEDFNQNKHVYFRKKCTSINLCFRSFTERITGIWCKVLDRKEQNCIWRARKNFFWKSIFL